MPQLTASGVRPSSRPRRRGRRSPRCRGGRASASRSGALIVHHQVELLGRQHLGRREERPLGPASRRPRVGIGHRLSPHAAAQARRRAPSGAAVPSMGMGEMSPGGSCQPPARVTRPSSIARGSASRPPSSGKASSEPSGAGSARVAGLMFSSTLQWAGTNMSIRLRTTASTSCRRSASVSSSMSIATRPQLAQSSASTSVQLRPSGASPSRRSAAAEHEILRPVRDHAGVAAEPRRQPGAPARQHPEGRGRRRCRAPSLALPSRCRARVRAPGACRAPRAACPPRAAVAAGSSRRGRQSAGSRAIRAATAAIRSLAVSGSMRAGSASIVSLRSL